ncbi:MAG TPA: MarR family transcriptional regulator [Candidatus Parcubacteria bacterium]|nr:MarR family transcriptional regulator [Candidatus Parcubacteria bacterium]
MNSNNKTINRTISLIFKTSRLIRERLRKEKKRPDPFSVLRLEALRYIAEKKSPLMKEVADYFCITPPSATSLINPLVRSGMLKRVYDKNDRRIIHLFISSKGRKELKRGFDEINNNMKKFLTQLNMNELKSLIRILEKLSKIYENSN